MADRYYTMHAVRYVAVLDREKLDPDAWRDLHPEAYVFKFCYVKPPLRCPKCGQEGMCGFLRDCDEGEVAQLICDALNAGTHYIKESEGGKSWFMKVEEK